MAVTMALQGCSSHHVDLISQGRTLDNLGFSGSISIRKLSKFKASKCDLGRNLRFHNFQVQMRQTEVPRSKYGTNGRAVKMVPATELVKRRTASGSKTVNGSEQAVNGAGLVRKDPNAALTKTVKSRNTNELPPLEELKVLPSDEGFNWANENYNSLQRSIDVWSFVISLRIRVLLDNAKWAYVGGFTEEKQVGGQNFVLIVDFHYYQLKTS